MRETPEYLEAPDNEDSEGKCRYCGQDADDDGRYPDLCWECNDEAAREEYYDRLYDEMQDRAMSGEEW